WMPRIGASRAAAAPKPASRGGPRYPRAVLTGISQGGIASTWLLGGLLGLGLAPGGSSRAEIAGCQLGCDGLRDDQLRATCKLRCFKDPDTAAAPVSKPAPTPAPTPSAAGASTAPKAEPGKAQPAKTEPAKTEPAKTEPAKTEPTKAQPSSQAGRSPSEVAHCQHQCDANLSLS